ncbi:helix-turn-helix domain-containing protein [Thalassolituus sp.]|jgi:DNA-binding Xre family transcriptional regulator|uniref:helix-turn-helix domain-containing protein n=1 Tax=Thalassolituus sp. TaxID=2030822 RepID=UPI003512C0E1
MSQLVTYNSLVGYQLFERRKALGVDQATVSTKTGISQPVLSRLEKGAAIISTDQLFVICKALECKPSDILKAVESVIDKLNGNEQLEVKTTKEANTAGAFLAGAAIGTALTFLLAKK